MFVLSRRLGFLVLVLLALCSAGSVLPSAQAPAAADDEFAGLVRKWTTRPEFLSPLVDHLPIAAGIPPPKDVIGRHVGEPKKLADDEDILRYYRALAAATPRVTVMEIGTSDEGRPRVVLAIASQDMTRVAFVADVRRTQGNRGQPFRAALLRGVSPVASA